MTKATQTKTIHRASKSSPARKSSSKKRSVNPRTQVPSSTTRAVKMRASLPGPEAKVTCKAALLALLTRPDGAELSELVKATGWQVHSVRAALTHFRQAGHVVNRIHQEEGGARYRVVSAG